MQQMPIFILIYLLGVFITKLLLGKAPLWFVQSAGFFVGLFNWVVTSLVVILITGKFHFMPVLIINVLELVFCIYLLIRTDIKSFNTFRFYQKTYNDRWLVITCAMLMAFNFSRTENVFLSLMMLFIVLSQGIILSRYAKITLNIFLLVNIVWQLILLNIVLKYPESMLNAGLIVATIIIILGFELFYYLLKFPKFKIWIARRFIWKYMLVLTLALILAFCINAQNTLTSIKSNLITALVTGGWDLAWPILISLIVVICPKSFQLDKDYSICSITLWLIGTYVFILAINIFRAPYHIGWGDSANRIYTEMQPIAMLLIIYLLKYKTMKAPCFISKTIKL